MYKKNGSTSEFKYRTFFACDGHLVQAGSEPINGKVEYQFSSKTDCKQFIRQLTWPAEIEVFETSRIKYLGGRGPAAAALRSLLILRKAHSSDQSPTMTFTLNLQKSHEPVTYYVREFLPQAEVTTKEAHPEITLRLNSTRGAPSLSGKSNRTIKYLYRDLDPLLSDIDLCGLTIQFASVSGECESSRLL